MVDIEITVNCDTRRTITLKMILIFSSKTFQMKARYILLPYVCVFFATTCNISEVIKSKSSSMFYAAVRRPFCIAKNY